jgi:hypothetical protein
MLPFDSKTKSLRINRFKILLGEFVKLFKQESFKIYQHKKKQRWNQDAHQ